MRIDVLTVPDCPNAPVLLERLEHVLHGRADTHVHHRVIADLDQAKRFGMHGSPTALIDGLDPFATPGTSPSMSCRLYRDQDGHASGAPSTADLRRVLGLDGGNTPSQAASLAAGRGGRGRLAPVEHGWRAVHQAVLLSFAEIGRSPQPGVLDRAAAPFGRTGAQVLAELADHDFLTLDEHGWIAAAYPFSATPTSHTVEIKGGARVWSMCAIDALGIPVMLGRDVQITSTDPHTGNPVHIRFTDGAAVWQPADAVVFYGARTATGSAAAVCCGYLHFFQDHASATAWAGEHPEAAGQILDHADAERTGADIFGPCLTGAH